MTKVKVCGITNIDDALVAAELGADALGFNFYPKSPRYVSPEKAAYIIKQLPPFLTTVGVFVNEARGKVEEMIEVSGIDAVQLHGDEPPAYCVAFQDVKVIKVCRVSDDFDPGRLGDYAGLSTVDAYLLDAYHKELYGGTGKTFNWEAARRAKEYGPIILAGGLTPENVRQAIEAVQPYGVDVSSGVERSPGLKDREKIRGFLMAAKGTGR